MQNRLKLMIVICLVALSISPAIAQQKGQYLPGQFGLNAGVMPSPGLTYVNMDLNYSAGTLNDQNGQAVRVTGNYSVWVIENILIYVPKVKILGGNLGFTSFFPSFANGSLTIPEFGISGGGYGLTDTWIQPFTLGWHLKRADIRIGDGFIVPTGRYSPGATNNVGSGYFGNDLITGSTVYLTKNKATSANLFTDWEAHGSKLGPNGTRETPGQTFTDEWGLGQVVPLNKKLTKLLQLGAIGYDQWQVSANGGSLANGAPASLVPFYSVHAAGVQANFILPDKNLSVFFKYEGEYEANAHALGRTVVFGALWTLRDKD